MSSYDFDAEAAVLACILHDSSAYWRVADLISAEDFRSTDLRALWTTIAEQLRTGGAADAVTIGEVDPSLAIVAVDVARNTVASSHNLRSYAELLAKRALERKVKQAGQRIAALSGEDTLGEAQRILAACVPRGRSSIETLQQLVRKSLAGIVERGQSDEPLTGVPSGIEPLDELTGGWQRNDLVIVAARPSVGKTAFALQASIAAAQAGHPVLFFSLEMGAVQLADRAIAHLTGVNALHIRDPRNMDEDEWPKITSAPRLVDGLPFRIDDSANATVDAIAARARQVNAEERLGLIVIDYLTYIQPPKAENTTEGIQIITRQLKSLAKELSVPVLLLSQLTREGDDEPELRHLRGSGAIEQDADAVVMLHRPQKDNRDLVKLKLAKQRNGPLGEVYLAADMARQRFTPTTYAPPVVQMQPRPRGFGGSARRAGYDG